MPLSALKSTLPVVGNPFNLTKAKTVIFDDFCYNFANTMPEKEAREMDDQWIMPAPCRPLFHASVARLGGTATKVNTDNTTRGPLLITGGSRDTIAPPIFGEASAAKYNKSGVTEFHVFEG